MKRTCYDNSGCDYEYNKPDEVAFCDRIEESLVEKNNTLWIIGITISVFLIILLFVLLGI